MSRPLTPAERHERALARMDLGSMHGQASQAAPVRRQGPKGRVVPSGDTHEHDLYDQTPEAVVEGAGAVGVADVAAPGDHSHPFDAGDHDHDLYASLPAPVEDSAGAVGVSDLASPGDHKHPFDPDTLGLASDPHGNEAHDPAMATSADFTAHTGETETAHGADVNATPNAIARRNAAGQVSVAPATADAHAIALEQATVNATANAIARRNASGQVEVGDATAAAHAIPMGQADTRYGTGVTLAADSIAESDPGTDWGEGLRIMPATTGAGYPANGVLVSWRDATTVHQVHLQEGAVTQRHRAWNEPTTFWAPWFTYADETALDNHEAASNPHSGSASTTALNSHTGATNPHTGHVDKAGDTMTGDLSVNADVYVDGARISNSGALLWLFRNGGAGDAVGIGPSAGGAAIDNVFIKALNTLVSGDLEAEGDIFNDTAVGGDRVLTSLVGTRRVDVIASHLNLNPKGNEVQVQWPGVGYNDIRAANFLPPSDARLKTDIEDSDLDGLAEVMACRLRMFRMKVPKTKRPHGPPAPNGLPPDPVPIPGEWEDTPVIHGLVAQEAPEGMRGPPDDEGMLSLNLEAQIVRLIGAVQRQQEQIEALKARLA